MAMVGETEAGSCRDATMPRDNLAGASALLKNPHRIGRPRCLENPRPKGGMLTNGERQLSIFTLNRNNSKS